MKQITDTEVSCLLEVLRDVQECTAAYTIDDDAVTECIEILEGLQNYEEKDE